MIICADDYGLRRDINEAILQLVDNRRISAVSCLVAGPSLDAWSLNEMKRRRFDIEVGLHICLTDLPPCGSPQSVKDLVAEDGNFLSHKRLVMRSLIGRVSPRQVLQEMTEQYNRFQELFGFAPDFIDGHLHVHQLSGVREGLIGFIKNLPCRGQNLWVRNSCITAQQLFYQGFSYSKCLLLTVPGLSIRAMLDENRIPTNVGFGGVYNYKNYRLYHRYLRRFIDCAVCTNDLIMVHPGFDEAWRKAECDALFSAEQLPRLINRFDFSGRSARKKEDNVRGVEIKL